jgi:MFS family permease
MTTPQAKPDSLGPAFNRLWSASLASNLADGLFKTSALLLAATLTKDPVVISILAAVVMLPWLLFAIPIGGLVDRIDRRLLLATANAIRFAMAAFLAVTVALDFVTIPILYLVAFVIGAAEVLYDTTSQSMIPQVLKTKHLERGNARLEIGAVTVGEFIGTPLSGLLFTAAIALPFALGSAGILVAVVLVLMIPGNFRKAIATDENNVPTEPTTFWADIRFGIRYLYENKTLLKLVLLTANVGMFSAATSSTVVLFLTEELAVEPVWFGFVFVVPAVGAIVGSITAPKVSALYGRTTVMAYSMIAFCLAAVLTGLSPNVFVFALVGLLMSVTVTWWNVLLMSTYHQIIPNALFGRIHGTRRTLVWGLMPIGSLLGGFIAQYGLRMPYFIAGGVALIIAFFGFRFTTRLTRLLKSG